jgi:GWxTD domain-containing protein
MRKAIILFFTLLTTVSLFAQTDPASAIAQARQQISDKQYDAAVKTLEAGFAGTSSIVQEQQKAQATAALHFYSAIAYSGMNDNVNAKKHLQEFFVLNPQASALDASKYDKKFVKLFNDVRKSARDDGASRFELIYPGYNPAAPALPKQVSLEKWHESPEFVLLASGEEKKAWDAATDEMSRQAVVDQFWLRRDPTPNAGSNEYREEARRRIAFADEVFSTPKTRGSLSDRGKVFVLFGPPQSISVKPLTSREGGDTRSSSAIDSGTANRAGTGVVSTDGPTTKGLVERWTYTYEQMPPTVPKTGVSFKFITEEGYGDHVLQRESVALKAIADAGRK